MESKSYWSALVSITRQTVKTARTVGTLYTLMKLKGFRFKRQWGCSCNYLLEAIGMGNHGQDFFVKIRHLATSGCHSKQKSVVYLIASYHDIISLWKHPLQLSTGLVQLSYHIKPIHWCIQSMLILPQFYP